MKTFLTLWILVLLVLNTILASFAIGSLVNRYKNGKDVVKVEVK